MTQLGPRFPIRFQLMLPAVAVSVIQVLASRIGKDLHDLGERVKRLADGNSCETSRPKWNDEMMDLSVAVNQTAHRLARYEDEIRQTERMRTVAMLAAGLVHEMRWMTPLIKLWTSFSFVGLATATLFFAASLTPSLLPRHYAVQGVLSGFALALGYGVGVFLVWLWLYLEIPRPTPRFQLWGKSATSLAVACVAALFLWRATIWQNSILRLMEMEPVATAYPRRVAFLAVVMGILLVLMARAIFLLWRYVDGKTRRWIPRRISYAVSTLLVAVLLLLIVNDVIARFALNFADAVFLELDKVVDDGMKPPSDPSATGSGDSLVPWKTLGRFGKEFILAGPTRKQIGEFWNREVLSPLRVYVGLRSEETPQSRAEMALRELLRVHAFQRSVLVVATPTGTGWLDPGGVDTLEYLHAGNTAIVSMQYSYLPSWITILVDSSRARDSATALFNAVYSHWKTLPRDSRPRLYLYGLSLGALGSSASMDLFTVFEDPIHGGLWSGPPFPSSVWSRATRYRKPDSPMWLPRYRDGSMLRFTGRENSLSQGGSRWGPMRFVYIQHASDPMTFFSTQLLHRRPEWLVGGRGPDVSPYLRWYPIVTFLQTAFDLPMATSVPAGYGHNYAPSSYMDAWIEITQPAEWDCDKTERLKKYFAGDRRS